MSLNELYRDAGLAADDISRMPSYIEGDDEFYGSEAFGKLSDYFCDSGEMPYNIQKCRDGTPDEWILERIEVISDSQG